MPLVKVGREPTSFAFAAADLGADGLLHVWGDGAADALDQPARLIEEWFEEE